MREKKIGDAVMGFAREKSVNGGSGEIVTEREGERRGEIERTTGRKGDLRWRREREWWSFGLVRDGSGCLRRRWLVVAEARFESDGEGERRCDGEGKTKRDREGFERRLWRLLLVVDGGSEGVVTVTVGGDDGSVSVFVLELMVFTVVAGNVGG